MPAQVPESLLGVADDPLEPLDPPVPPMFGQLAGSCAWRPGVPVAGACCEPDELVSGGAVVVVPPLLDELSVWPKATAAPPPRSRPVSPAAAMACRSLNSI
jgi:hypothetical protein